MRSREIAHFNMIHVLFVMFCPIQSIELKYLDRYNLALAFSLMLIF